MRHFSAAVKFKDILYPERPPSALAPTLQLPPSLVAAWYCPEGILQTVEDNAQILCSTCIGGKSPTPAPVHAKDEDDQRKPGLGGLFRCEGVGGTHWRRWNNNRFIIIYRYPVVAHLCHASYCSSSPVPFHLPPFVSLFPRHTELAY